jgi:hypothetical protein
MSSLSRFATTLVLSVVLSPLLGVGAGLLLVVIERIAR